MSFINKLSISTKNGLFGILFSFIFGITVTCTINLILNPYLLSRAQEQINTNLVLARTIVELKYGTNYSLKDDHLLVGTHVIDEDINLVDQITSLFGKTGDVMTIFKGDTRILTNIRDTKTGARAIGTKLATGPAYDAVFREKTKYQGDIMILGEPYLSAYDPIFDNNGKVIGIFFVGINKTAELAIITRLELIIGSAIALISVFMAGGIWTISRYRMKPLLKMVKVVESLRQGNTEVNVPSLERGDEIGKIAYAIQTFKDDIIEKKRLQEERAQAVDAYTKRAEEIIRLQTEKQQEMESNAKRAEQLIEMQTERVYELAHKEKRTKRLFDLNMDFEKSVQNTLGLFLKAQTDLNETAKDMSLNVTKAATVVQSAESSISNISSNTKSIAAATEELKSSSVEISRQTSNFSEFAKSTLEAIESIPFGVVMPIRNTLNKMAEISVALAGQIENQGTATAEISRNVNGVADEAEKLLIGVSGAKKIMDIAGARSKNVLDAANCLGAQSSELNKTVKEYLKNTSRI
jgi:methyl-accepting chemotaxis protein